jgi:ribosomal protein S8E
MHKEKERKPNPLQKQKKKKKKNPKSTSLGKKKKTRTSLCITSSSSQKRSLVFHLLLPAIFTRRPSSSQQLLSAATAEFVTPSHGNSKV